jgi:hypothetical protein
VLSLQFHPPCEQKLLLAVVVVLAAAVVVLAVVVLVLAVVGLAAVSHVTVTDVPSLKQQHDPVRGADRYCPASHATHSLCTVRLPSTKRNPRSHHCDAHRVQVGAVDPSNTCSVPYGHFWHKASAVVFPGIR